MNNKPMIVTERLILRPPAAEDFEGFAEFGADEDTMLHLGGVQSRAEAWRGMCAIAGSWQIEGFGFFSLIERETGEWIGRVGPWKPEGWPGTEVGWGVLPRFAGKGFAKEAAIASIDYAFTTLGWDDVIHTINPENHASIKLAEALGSKNRGPTKLPAPYADIKVDDYGQSREQWLARKQ